MITFLRKTRKTLFDSGKAGRYILYAIGEIFLVVIGILIALQINNWNESNKRDKRELVLLKELVGNLKTNVNNLNNDIASQVESANIIDFLIDHLDNRRPYFDSLDYYFSMSDFAPDVILTSSAFETLKSSGLELIKSPILRTEIINLFEVTYPYLLQETKRLEDQVWPAVVVPMIQKHFREEMNRYIPTNYEALLNDVEFINMLSKRGRMRKSSTTQKKEAKAKTERIIDLIEDELQRRT